MARQSLLIIAAGLGGWLLASTAFAATADEAPSVRVRYADLDLTKDAGIESLYARLSGASARVCGEVDIRNLSAFAAQQACMRAALDRAVNDVHSARLTARHKGAAAGTRFARLD